MRVPASKLTDLDKAWIRRARRKGVPVAEIGAHFGQGAQWASTVCVKILKLPKRNKCMPPIKMDEAQWAYFERMWLDGMSCYAIGDRFGRGHDWASYNAQRRALPPRKSFRTNKQVEEVKRRIAAGESREAISQVMGIPYTSVVRMTRGAPRKPDPKKKVNVGRADRMVRQGMTHREVAKAFGVTKSAVTMAVKRYRAIFKKAA